MIGLDAQVRPLEPGDRDRLVRMFDRLSRETITRRFFTLLPRLDGPLLRALTQVDHEAHEALVVQVGDEVVALGSYHRSPADPTVADIAVLVEDGWHHHGLGRRLVRDLTRLARARGVTTLHADVRADNRAAIGLIRRMGQPAAPAWTGESLSYDLPLAPAA